MTASLPPLQQHDLDDEALDSLVRDLTQLAEILEVRGKRGPGYATIEELPLHDAIGQLREQLIRGVQIRYLFDGQEWLDTLIVTAAGIRLTRLLLDDRPVR
jgi:hypothetical protein